MKANYGKEFEKRFKTQWTKCFPDQFIYRLKDDTSGFYGSSNPCDFLVHIDNTLFLLEVKSHYGNTFPWSAFRQYDEMLKFRNKKNVQLGLIVWFIEHDTIIYVDLDTITQMMNDNLKSINIKKLESQNYKYLKIPSVKKRVFLESDYTCMKSLIE